MLNLRTIRACQGVRLRRDSGRRGSTLIIVIALLASLMLLGFLFLTISSQEQENAYNFAEAAKVPQAGSSGGAGYFDPFLEQLILGARDDYYNSALWGGRNSLLPTMFGNDLQPYNGEGINLTWIGQSGGTPGYAVVDQEFDGSPGPNFSGLLFDGYDDDLASINLSPAAWYVDGGMLYPTPHDVVGEVAGTPGGMLQWPPADVDYTRPDLASPFLAFVTYEPTTGQRVVIPSFHRPQYLRDLETMLAIGPNPVANWYTNPDFAKRTLRPHRSHVAVTAGGADSGWPRFVTSNADADFVDIGEYPFDTKLDGATPRDEGVWWGSNPPSFTADADNDGLYEAEYIDLGLPEQVSADGTKTTVPLVAFTVYDADALFNLNAQGNLYGDIAMDSGAFGDADNDGVAVTPTQNDYLSRSNQAFSPSEVNLEVGLDQSTLPAAPVQPFGHMPANNVELANMEFWFLKTGRAEVDASNNITALYTGQYGEDSRLRAGTEALLGGGAAMAPKLFPYPGASEVDDQLPPNSGSDAYVAAGTMNPPVSPLLFDATGRVFPMFVSRLPYQHPLDSRGSGRYVMRTVGGKSRAFQTPSGTRFRLPYYADYAEPVSADAINAPNWRNHLGGNVLVTLPLWAGLYSVAPDSRIDHPNETWLSTRSGGSQDLIFPPGETATLQFADGTDQDVISFSQRLLTLAPENFGQGKDGAQARRRMYTTYSADLKTHSGTPVHPNAVAGRPWEQTPDPTLGGAIAFPPTFPGVVAPQTQPFRDEVRALLRDAAPADLTLVDRQTLMRKLSVNQVASLSQENRIRLRPLTPHPRSLGSAAITPLMPSFGVPDMTAPKTWSIGNAAAQEWHARRDRQNLARDIYVLLYTLGKADTTSGNPVQTPNVIDWNTGDGTVYSLTELREMAQFAVNLVDAMDEDDTVTCFVYDLNLADGYTDIDDGYTNPISPVVDTTHDDTNTMVDTDGDGIIDNDYYDQANNRGIVYGVEAQQLALGEALVVLAKENKPASGPATDHQATDWDDTRPRDFTFVELQNLTPREIRMDGGWSIVCQVNLDPAAGTPLPPRAVTLVDSALQVGALEAFTVGTAGDAHNVDRPSPADPRTVNTASPFNPTRPSHFSIDMDGTPTVPPATWDLFDQIAPVRMPPDLTVVQELDFDMMVRDTSGQENTLRLNNVDVKDLRFDDIAFGGVDDNEQPSATPTSPKAGGWLNLGPQSDPGDPMAPNPRDALTPTVEVTFTLRRRLNLDRQSPAAGYPNVTHTDPSQVPDDAIERDNPWIVVDSMNVLLSEFQNPDGQALLTLVDAVQSQERIEPLDLSTKQPAPNYANTPTTAYNDFNSLGDISLGTKQLWQPHFDRPFASLGDILSVPLYGPRMLTQRLVTASTTTLNRNYVAASRVLFPDGGAYGSGQYNNLWYRAFEYLSVPEADGGNQSYAGSATPDPWFAIDGGFPVVDATIRQNSNDVAGPYQRFGKLNLNTLRHPHVYAGMLDDFSVMGRPQGQLPNASWNMGTQSGENLDATLPLMPDASRRWWTDFLISRDGYDPHTGLVLPGLAVGRTDQAALSGQIFGRPFRSTAMALRAEGGSAAVFGDDPADLRRSLDDTIFRRLPMTTPNVNARGLFELGTSGEADTAAFDFSTRYRLLSKVLNHSTTRSNVFLVFIDVKHFNAKVKYLDPALPETKYVRIGAPDTTANANSPRGFFVIDRSKALELIKESDLPQNNQYINPLAPAPVGSAPVITSSFARNPDGTPTFDWRALVLSSTRIR